MGGPWTSAGDSVDRDLQAHGQREATEVGETCAHCNARVTSKSGYNAVSLKWAEGVDLSQRCVESLMRANISL